MPSLGVSPSSPLNPTPSPDLGPLQALLPVRFTFPCTLVSGSDALFQAFGIQRAKATHRTTPCASVTRWHRLTPSVQPHTCQAATASFPGSCHAVGTLAGKGRGGF